MGRPQNPLPAAITFGVSIIAAMNRASAAAVRSNPCNCGHTAAVSVVAMMSAPGATMPSSARHTPISVTDLQSNYHLGVGNQMLDLVQLELNGATKKVAATVGIGDMDVVVPDNVKVVVRARAGAGEVRLFDRNFGGTQLDRTITMAATGKQAGELDLDLRVGLGQVQIWQAPAVVPVPSQQGAQS